jgi:hypothetical protein
MLTVGSSVHLIAITAGVQLRKQTEVLEAIHKLTIPEHLVDDLHDKHHQEQRRPTLIMHGRACRKQSFDVDIVVVSLYRAACMPIIIIP